jgi:hypothetical protein
VYGAPLIEKTVHWRATLPPAYGASGPHAGALTVAGIILAAMRPLQADLDAALARDDRPAALKLAYRALVPVADTLVACTGCPLRPGQARVHALLVELEPLPFLVAADGTLADQGTTVTVHYRNWQVTAAAAGRLAAHLSQEFQAQWPDARFVISGNQGDL